MSTYDDSNDLLRILDDLDDLIATARTVPMSASVVVNRDDVLDLIDAARNAVPTAVRQAEGIVADADDVLSQGRDEAERLILRAHEEAERLIASEAIVRQATMKADEIIHDAETKAQALRDGANAYSDRSLAHLEEELHRLSEQVSAGRAALAERMGRDQGESVPVQGPRPTSVPSPASAARRRAHWSVDPSRSTSESQSR